MTYYEKSVDRSRAQDCRFSMYVSNAAQTALNSFKLEAMEYNRALRRFYDALYRMNVEADILQHPEKQGASLPGVHEALQRDQRSQEFLEAPPAALGARALINDVLSHLSNDPDTASVICIMAGSLTQEGTG